MAGDAAPEGVFAEFEFDSQPGHALRCRLSPMPLRGWLAFRRDFSTPGTYDDFEATITRFAALTEASCSCGGPFLDHDVNAVRAAATLWVDRVMEVDPPLPVGSSGRTPSPVDSTPTARRSSRRRS